MGVYRFKNNKYLNTNYFYFYKILFYIHKKIEVESTSVLGTYNAGYSPEPYIQHPRILLLFYIL